MSLRAWTHRGVEPIRHELALAVRWYERDGAVVLEARQTDTLMELHVLQLHCLTLFSWQTNRRTKQHSEWLKAFWGSTGQNQGQSNDDWQTSTSSLLQQAHTVRSRCLKAFCPALVPNQVIILQLRVRGKVHGPRIFCSKELASESED